MAPSLTNGAIVSIMSGDNKEKPVLQVLGSKKIPGNTGGSDRYRLLLSDGEKSHSSAMLATQLNNLVTDGQLETFTVIQLDKYLTNQIQPGRLVMILLDITILESGASVQSKLGNPQPYRPTESKSKEEPQNSSVPPAENKPPSREPLAANNRVQNAPHTPQQGTIARKPFGGNAPDTPGGTPSKVHPINSLTPYQNRWCIRARVTTKSAIKTWSNARGEGKLFSMNLLDESGEIRATAFTQEVDKFYDMIETNKVYYIRKAQLKTANKQYSSVDNDYEMTFGRETEVILCTDTTDLPTVNFNFVPINELEKHESGGTVDVIGVVKHVADLSVVNSKSTNKEIKKRDVQLVDESKVLVRLTLWGSDAESFDGSTNPVLAIRGCRISDWGGRSLSALVSSQLILNPDIPEAHRVKGWYDTVGHSADYNEFKSDGPGGGGSSHSTNWKTFAEIKGQPIPDNQPLYFTAKATIIHMKKDNCLYQACPQQDCNKKVIDQSNGYYRCEKCQKEYPNYKWRLILQANLADFSDNQWITCFQDTAEAILGKSGDDLGVMKEQDEAGYDRVFTEASFKSYIFKMRAKLESFNDESRLKTICVAATPLDYHSYNKKLIGDIEAMLAG